MTGLSTLKKYQGGTAMRKNNDGKVYIWSDLHLGHENVIRYCNRPFAGVSEMNTVLLNAWKSTVKSSDDHQFGRCRPETEQGISGNGYSTAAGGQNPGYGES
jgi:hypothetical protein